MDLLQCSVQVVAATLSELYPYSWYKKDERSTTVDHGITIMVWYRCIGFMGVGLTTLSTAKTLKVYCK